MKVAVLVLAVLVGIAALLLAAGGLEPLKTLSGAGPSPRLMGTLAADEAVISAKRAGRLERVLVEEGSAVEAEQIVAVLDRAELEAEREVQLARIEQVESKIRRSEEVVSLERGRARKRTQRAAAGLQVVRSQIEQSVARKEQRAKDLERTEGLFRRGLVARAELEQAETALKVAEAEWKAFADRAAEAEAEVALARADERQAEVLENDVEQHRAERLQARAALKQIEARLDDAAIRSPIRGVVSRRICRTGEVVQPGAPILVIIDPDDMWVKVAVEETIVHRLVVGQAMTVEVPGLGSVEGQIVFLAPEAEFATQRDVDRVRRDIRTFTVKVAVPNPERRLHAGMSAYVHLPPPAPARSPGRPEDGIGRGEPDGPRPVARTSAVETGQGSASAEPAAGDR